jgi:tRNA-2-methylthio-N6-dimethylallyladenosine synthase
MAQNYKDSVFQRAPAVDFVVGPADIDKIPAIIKSLSAVKHKLSPRSLFEKKIWETNSLARPEEIYHTGYYQDKKHAYVVISEGCSNYCSYCVVPYVRGQLKNRNYQDILREIEEATAAGITSVTLLGQNVNAYQSPGLNHQQSIDFKQLLKMVDGIKGLKEFSFVTSHPKDTTLDLFRVISELKKLKKYLHLPVQSGSDKILKLMNRDYTRKYYLDLVRNYRRIVRGGSLSTDIIVGFPGESQDDFLATYNLLKEIKFDCAYIFKYSVRPHTPAERLVDDVTRAEKEKRHQLALNLQKGISRKCLKN